VDVVDVVDVIDVFEVVDVVGVNLALTLVFTRKHGAWVDVGVNWGGGN
jgi:hypothetical protein